MFRRNLMTSGSSYHFDSVAVMCIFSRMSRQPMPVYTSRRNSLLRPVRDDAHLGAAEVVVDKPETHPAMNRNSSGSRAAIEFPTRRSAQTVRVRRDESCRSFEASCRLRRKIPEPHVRRRRERIVFFRSASALRPRRRPFRSASLISASLWRVLGIEKPVTGTARSFAIDHHRHADTAFGGSRTRFAPLGVWPCTRSPSR